LFTLPLTVWVIVVPRLSSPTALPNSLFKVSLLASVMLFGSVSLSSSQLIVIGLGATQVGRSLSSISTSSQQ